MKSQPKERLGTPLKKRGDLALQVLLVAAVTGAAIIALPLLPALGIAVSMKNKADRRRTHLAFGQLVRKGYAERVPGRRGTIRLTARGKNHAAYEALTIRKRAWDGKWRLFMFDIPENKRGARIALSHKVLAMGMHAFQKSIYISPFPCEEQLMSVARFLGVERHVRMATAEHISDEQHFRKALKLIK